MSFDPTKPVQTHDGRKARILATNINGQFNTVVVVTEPGGEEYVYRCLANGRFKTTREVPIDLINIPEKITHFLNVYPDDDSIESLNVFSHTTLSDAMHNRSTACLGILELTIADGKLIDVIVHS